MNKDQTLSNRESSETEIAKPVKIICNVTCHAFFIIILAALLIASAGYDNPWLFGLAAAVGVIYYFTIAKIMSGAFRLYFVLANYSIVAALFLLLVSILFPPWQYTADHNGEDGFHSRKPAGYSLIFCPPKPQRDGFAFGVKLDFGRLFLEWATLATVTGIVWVLVVKPAWLGNNKVNRPQKFITPTGNPKN